MTGLKFAEAIAHYAELGAVVLHPALVIERRGSMRDRLFLNEACDGGTVLLAVPDSQWCTRNEMRKRGAAFDVDFSEQIGRADLPMWRCLSSANGTPVDEVVEVAWRLAVERCVGASWWWGWITSLPTPKHSQTAMEQSLRRCRTEEGRLRYLPYVEAMQASVRDEIRQVHRIGSEFTLSPPLAHLEWAMHILAAFGGPILPKSLGVAPFIDLATCSNDGCVNAQVDVVRAATARQLVDNNEDNKHPMWDDESKHVAILRLVRTVVPGEPIAVPRRLSPHFAERLPLEPNEQLIVNELVFPPLQ